MKNLVVGVVVIVVAIVAFGFWRGWFEVGGKKEDGGLRANMHVNAGKFKDDKDSFKKYLSQKSKSMKDKLASLKDKAKGLAGDAKTKAEKEIDALTKKHEAIEGKMKEVDDVTEDKLEGLKKSVTDDLEAQDTHAKETKAK